MTRKKDKTEGMKWKELIGGQEDFLRPLVREVIQQVLEAEMEEVVGAGKGERTAERVGYIHNSAKVCEPVRAVNQFQRRTPSLLAPLTRGIPAFRTKKSRAGSARLA